MTPVRFVVQTLWALMRESQHLGTLLADKILIVTYFKIGKTGRGVLKAFGKTGKRLSFAHHVISKGPVKLQHSHDSV